MRTWIALIMIICGLGCGTAALAAAKNTPIELYSDGIRLAGNIWMPEELKAGERRPGVLLVHGWGGLKSHLNTAYAPQFAALGYVVLTFDYTGWGESDGVIVRTGARPDTVNGAETAQTYATEVTELRQIVNPLEQLDDIRAAVAVLSTHPQVDPEQLAVWGSSLGGGLALATAIEFPQFKVLISQVGSVNPQAGFTDDSPDNPLAPANMASWRGAIARGEAPAFPSEAAPGLRGYPDWPDFVRYDPMHNLDSLRAATLVVDAAEEELFDIAENGALLHARIKGQVPSRYATIPGTHYDVYRDDGYAQALAMQKAWLKKHLPVSP